MKRELTEHDLKLSRIAREGTVEEYVEAMLEHPEYGRLMRAFALEEAAPEHQMWLDWMEAQKAGDTRTFEHWMEQSRQGVD